MTTWAKLILFGCCKGSTEEKGKNTQKSLLVNNCISDENIFLSWNEGDRLMQHRKTNKLGNQRETGTIYLNSWNMWPTLFINSNKNGVFVLQTVLPARVPWGSDEGAGNISLGSSSSGNSMVLSLSHSFLSGGRPEKTGCSPSSSVWRRVWSLTTGYPIPGMTSTVNAIQIWFSLCFPAGYEGKQLTYVDTRSAIYSAPPFIG